MSILEFTYDEFVKEIKSRYGKGPFYSGPIYRSAFHKAHLNLERSEIFSQNPLFLNEIKKNYGFKCSPIVDTLKDEGTLKWVTQLIDGARIESVVIPMANYATLCISSQVGCRMGCRFCRTGQMGFHRQLSTHEIVEQVLNARVTLGLTVRNIVFMGMGEPLDNFDNTLKAIKVMKDQRGLNIAERRITLSTAGLADKIEMLPAQGLKKVNLAISLNAPTDAIRDRLMPVNQKFPMARLKQALLTYPTHQSDALWVQYVLIKGVNDRKDHADALSQYLRFLKVKVNVIPCNEGGASDIAIPDMENTERFIAYLVEHRLFVRRRKPKGRALSAACGQLGSAPL